MNDWKSDLRAIKKVLAKPTESTAATSHRQVTSQAVAVVCSDPVVPAPASVTARLPAPALNNVGAAKPKGKTPTQHKPAPPHPALEPMQQPRLARIWKEAALAELVWRAEQSKPQTPSHNKPPVTAPQPVPAVPKERIKPPAPVPTSIRALRKISTERQKFFREPADWVAEGAKTQLPGVPAKPSIDVMIGIDFGTSYTKAAVGMQDKIYPVDWSGVVTCPQPLLLPSEYTALSDGRVFLGQRPGAASSEVKLDLKVPFINPGVSNESIAIASIFLSQTLRYIRAWIYEFHRAKIGNTNIRWHVNLGAPCNGLEDTRLTSAYRRLGRTAWSLSQLSGDVTLGDAVARVAASANEVNTTDLHSLDVFPEFVAQMAGYVQSPQRRRGLHAIADVGGGTLDVVTFIVHQVDDEDTFPFLIPEVKNLGTHMLNQNRTVGVLVDEGAQLPDELMPVLNAAAFAAATSVDLNHVKARDEAFCTHVSNVVKKVLATTKAKRYRRSEAWASGLRTFLTGGGASVGAYSEAVKRGGLGCTSHIELIPLPLHPRIADFHGDAQLYQRLSVACGLAQDAFSLGRIIPAKDVEDDIATTGPARGRSDRDEVYAK